MWKTFGSIPGWSTASGPGIELQNNNAGTQHGGEQNVELDSNGSSAIYQDIATIPGVSYKVSYWFSPRPGTSEADNVLQFSWDGSVIDVISASGADLADTSWTQYTYTLVATSAWTRLQFADLGTSNTLGTYLDDVSVTETEYGICPLYDVTKPAKAGATKPIKLQLCDGAGNNLSDPSLAVHVTGLVKLDNTASAAPVEDAGNANPDNDFRYDASLAGYIFNLRTGGLTSGTWAVQFTVNGGQTIYTAQFDVR